MGHISPWRRPVHHRAAAQPQGRRRVPRAWMQDHQPNWQEAHRAPGARPGDPDQVHSTCEAPWPSAGGYRIMWVHHSGKQLRDAATLARRIEKGVQAIEDDLAARLSSSRTRLRTSAAVHAAAEAPAPSDACARRLLGAIHRDRQDRGAVRQAGPGLPGPVPAYRRIEKKRPSR